MQRACMQHGTVKGRARKVEICATAIASSVVGSHTFMSHYVETGLCLGVVFCS